MYTRLVNVDGPISNHLPDLVALRHDLHAHPELGYEEVRTSMKVVEELAKAGIDHVAGLARGTGVLGYLPATQNSETAKTVALRADMDALPIHEETDLPYSSLNPGKMHACGHDGHTTILVGTARILAQTAERPNNVLFLFQPAEEGGAGGKAMVDEGALDGSNIGKPVDIIFGLHGYPNLKVGQVQTCVGPMLASADTFRLFLRGKGGHAAMPHTTIDPVVGGSHLVLALQTIVSRNLAPLESGVVTVGKFAAGDAHNIIPETATLMGTVRSLNDASRTLLLKRVEEVIAGVCQTMGLTWEIEWDTGYPVTKNDAGAVGVFREVARETLGTDLVEEDCKPVMGGEDFSFYGQKVPACFYWLGLLAEGQETYPNLHNPRFDFNDAAIPVGVKAMTALALRKH